MSDLSNNENVVAAYRAYQEVVGDTMPIEPLTSEQILRNDHGDGLLTFILFEAADAASLEEAASMLRRAAEQLIDTASLLLEEK